MTDNIEKLAQQMLASVEVFNAKINSLPPEKRKQFSEIQGNVNDILEQSKKNIQNASPNT